jgi:hypothetical protein
LFGGWGGDGGFDKFVGVGGIGEGEVNSQIGGKRFIV